MCMNNVFGYLLSPTAGRTQRLLYNTKCVVHERLVIRGSLSLSLVTPTTASLVEGQAARAHQLRTAAPQGEE